MEDRISAIRAEALRQGLLRRKTFNELFIPYCYQAIALLFSYALLQVTGSPGCHLLIAGVEIWMVIAAWRV